MGGAVLLLLTTCFFLVATDVLATFVGGCGKSGMGGISTVRNTFTRWDFVDIVIGVECIVEN